MNFNMPNSTESLLLLPPVRCAVCAAYISMAVPHPQESCLDLSFAIAAPRVKLKPPVVKAHFELAT